VGRDKERQARLERGIYVPGKGASAHTAPLRFDLLESAAYRALSNPGRLILLFMVKAWCKTTGWERRPASFSFSWAEVWTIIGEAAFLKARRELVAMGFFEARGEDQAGTPGAPIQYRASAQWMDFKPSAALAKQWADQDRYRRERVEKQHRRRARFKRNLGRKKSTACEVVASPTLHPAGGGSKRPCYRLRQGDEYPENAEMLPPAAGGYELTIESRPATGLEGEKNATGGGGAGGEPTREAVAVADVVGDVVANLKASVNGTGRAAALLARVEAVGGCKNGYRVWWRAVTAKLPPEGLDVLDERLDYVEKCSSPEQRRRKDLGELRRPGGFLAKQVQGWARTHHVRLPRRR